MKGKKSSKTVDSIKTSIAAPLPTVLPNPVGSGAGPEKRFPMKKGGKTTGKKK